MLAEYNNLMSHGWLNEAIKVPWKIWETSTVEPPALVDDTTDYDK